MEEFQTGIHQKKSDSINLSDVNNPDQAFPVSLHQIPVLPMLTNSDGCL